MAKRANHMLHFLRRNLRYCPKEARSLAYFSLVRSKMDYCASTWDPYLRKDIDRLEKINRRAVRFVSDLHPRDRTTSVTRLQNQLQWPTLENRRRTQRLNLMYKITHQLVAVPPTQLVPPTRHTRSNHAYKYQTLRAKTDIYKYSFYVRTIPEWNDLAAGIVESPSIDAFSNRLSKLVSQQ